MYCTYCSARTPLVCVPDGGKACMTAITVSCSATPCLWLFRVLKSCVRAPVTGAVFGSIMHDCTLPARVCASVQGCPCPHSSTLLQAKPVQLVLCRRAGTLSRARKGKCFKTIRQGNSQFTLKMSNVVLAKAVKHTCPASRPGRRLSRWWP